MPRLILALGVAALCVGCSSTVGEPTVPSATQPAPVTATAAAAPPTPSVTVIATPARSFDLYTHCGIHGALIDGEWWAASPTLDDGMGNPPKDWGNPYQPGVLTFAVEGKAFFEGTSESGQRLTASFGRTSITTYPFICA